jgi:DNA-binding transcriptional LysR family regulator
MLAARREVIDSIDAAREQVRGEVVVGNLMNVYTLDLPTLIADLHRKHPDITLQMRQSISGVTGNIAGLRDDGLDIALLAGAGLDLPGITVHQISAETLVLCTLPDHPSAGRPFRAADLEGARFIDFPPGWGIRGLADDRFPMRRPVIEVPDQIFALELVRKGFAIALVPRSVAERTQQVAFAEYADEPIPWLVGVGHNEQRTPSNAARAVIDAMCGGYAIARPCSEPGPVHSVPSL